MTAYVDAATEWPGSAIAPPGAGQGSIWAHMVADSLDELHAFAERLGLKRSHFQDGDHPHYDLTLGTWGQALRLGAQQATRQALLVIASGCKDQSPRRAGRGGPRS